MTESSDVHQEGSPAIEQAEQHTLGTSTYQKAEVLHQFADTHSWFHPFLIGLGVLFLLTLVLLVQRVIAKTIMHRGSPPGV